MSTILSHRDIIALWPSRDDLAVDIGLNTRRGKERVRLWQYRDSIPFEYHLAIARAAKRRKLYAVTVDLLAQLATRRTEQVA